MDNIEDLRSNGGSWVSEVKDEWEYESSESEETKDNIWKMKKKESRIGNARKSLEVY